MLDTQIKLAFYCPNNLDNDDKYKQSEMIAKDLNIKLINSIEDEDIKNLDYLLTWRSINNIDYLSSYLSLVDINFKKYIYIDYVNNIIANKKLYEINLKDSLAKAFGVANFKKDIKSSNSNINKIKILDATAGFTIDIFNIYNLLKKYNLEQYFEFTLIEQSKVLYYLIKDGLERANLEKFINLYNNNSVDYLNKNNQQFDIIYLDPMFDLKHNSAKPKENMQIIQNIGHNCLQTEDLLNTAMKYAKTKVILKRSNKHGKLISNKVNYSVLSKQLRYDIYLI